MKLVSIKEMKSIEKEADSNGLTFDQMMENAGQGLAEVINDLLIEDSEREIFGLVGPGNNGGDTLVAMTHLAADGWLARAYMVARKKDPLVERFEKAGGEVVFAEEDGKLSSLNAFIQTATIFLDGLLGTGAKLPLKNEFARILAEGNSIISNNDERPFVIAVDCPSGMDCDTGEAAPVCIPADLTVTMATVKQGQLKMPAYALIGDLQVVDIGLPDNLNSLNSVQVEVAEANMVSAILPYREVTAHKGSFGTALIVAGSVNYTGAALLTGEAAYRIGAGLVTMAVPSPIHGILAGHLAEATWILLPHEVGVISAGAAEVLKKNMERATALLVGPGLGVEDTTKDFIKSMFTEKPARENASTRIGFLPSGDKEKQETRNVIPPVVVDADGLKLLASIDNWHKILPPVAVLTPHPGEMSVLTGLSIEEIQKDRQTVANKFAKEWGHVVVLKGAFTLIASPDGRMTIIPVASSALARAGTGDVLAGLIVGLRAQGVEAFEAAVAGAWIHSQAGLYAASKLGTTTSVLAGDVLNSVSSILADLN
jgi:ADP-dependent NAD(P)H-hydrate dehydratase / NAD(P)H-hydrate epimerase